MANVQEITVTLINTSTNSSTDVKVKDIQDKALKEEIEKVLNFSKVHIGRLIKKI